MQITGRSTSIQTYDLSLNGGYAAIAAVALAVLYWGVFLPIQHETARITSQVDEFKDLIQTTSQITVRRQRLEQELAAKEEAVAQLLRRVPPAPHETEFLAQVCELAHRTGVEVTDYHPGTVEQRENYQELEVKFSGRGEYAALCRFLHHAEEIPRLCRLVQLEMSAGETGQPLACDFVYRIFFAPPAESESSKKGSST